MVKLKTRIEKVIHTDTNIQFHYSELNAVTNISQQSINNNFKMFYGISLVIHSKAVLKPLQLLHVSPTTYNKIQTREL